jgi:hypothetical protein
MTRVRIGADTIAAAYRAHMADQHAGNVGRGERGVCPTCRRYAAALVIARAQNPSR